MNKHTPAYAYLRVSHVSQAEEVKDGLTRQLRAIKAYAKQNRYLIAKIFEEAITGTESNRPELARLIDALEQNGIKVVIIEKLDRLARDLMVQEAIIKDFQKAGISLISALEGPDLLANDPTRKLVRQMFGAIAEYEKTMLVLKLQAAKARKRAAGGRAEGRIPFASDREKRPGDFELLKLMLDLRGGRDHGGPGMTMKQIADELNRRGYRTPSTKQPFTEANVSYMLVGKRRKKREGKGRRDNEKRS